MLEANIKINVLAPQMRQKTTQLLSEGLQSEPFFFSGRAELQSYHCCTEGALIGQRHNAATEGLSSLLGLMAG